MPYITGWISKAPAGVVLSPSRFVSETPFRPRWAVQGPSTESQHSPDLRQRRSEPVVERPLGATTVTSWIAEPASLSWFARFAGHVAARAPVPSLAAAKQSSTKAESAIPSAFRLESTLGGAMRTLVLAIFTAISLHGPPF